MVGSSFTNRARASQLLDFQGLEFGRCKCTDIDLSCDWQGRTFVFVEVKSGEKALTTGQSIHLRALVDGLRAGGKAAWAIVTRHNTPVEQDVIVGDSKVSMVYTGVSGYGWTRRVDGTQTLQELMDEIYQIHLEEGTQ